MTSLQIWIPHISLSNWVANGNYQRSSTIFWGQCFLIPIFTNSYKFPCSPVHHLAPKPTVLSPFQNIFLGSSGIKGGLSKINNIILDFSASSKPEHYSRWERELSANVSTSDWDEASTISLKLSRCINHSELIHKIHLRWYLTHARLAHMSFASSHFCWRQTDVDRPVPYM